ncbi:MAG TPA: hypothetical protein VJQ56_14320, partial [Blastocatellia bacterium]|nr:hypothetical protein [Blastocatellia bacterium]
MTLPFVSILPSAIRRAIALVLAAAFLTMSVPTSRADAQVASALNKLSPALQQALTSNLNLVWLNPTRRTVRALVQTNGPVTPGLLTAITLQGGSVVRQFSSINGLLVDLPKTSLLSLAARNDVERMSADHLAQQSASHLEAATGADKVRTYSATTKTF